MNNKLFKRIVAVAASAVMLSSCAFASELSNASYTAPDASSTAGTLKFSYKNNGADKVTYIAYAATKSTTDAGTDVNGTKYVLGEIVAIDQFDGLDTAKTDATEVTAKINASKIKTDNDAIVILSGDSKGTAAAGAVVNLKGETAGPKVTFMNGSVEFAKLDSSNGKVVLPDTSATAPTFAAEECYKDVNFTFVGWVDGNGAEVTANTDITEDMTVYAKFDTGHILGDINGNGKLQANDYTALKKYFTSNKVDNTYVNTPIYKGYTYVIGDTNTNGKLQANDYTALKKYFTSNKVNNTHMAEKVYIINK